jgi:tetratricopeptide (TPR) repeat protein
MIALILEAGKVANKYAARKMFDEGVAAYVKNDFQDSFDLFSRAIQYDPTPALFYVCRGAASLKLQKAREAIEDFNRAIKLDPLNARADHLRGIAYEKIGALARAFRDFDRSLEIDPEYAAAYPSRESVLARPKQPDASAADVDIVDHLMAMRLTDFDQKVPSDLAI